MRNNGVFGTILPFFGCLFTCLVLLFQLAFYCGIVALIVLGIKFLWGL